jgi:two-component system response regulator HydG
MTPRPHILIIDDEAAHAEATAEALARAGFEVSVATSGRSGLERLAGDSPDIVVTDIRMHDVDGMTILREARRRNPETKVIMITAYADIESARSAFKDGAFDYLVKPLDIGELRTAVERAAEKLALSRNNLQLHRRLDEHFGFNRIIGNTPAMVDLVALLRRIASTSATVLILGESGTGKELIANVIHQQSPRREAPFVALNVASFPEGIIESELFGHERGAFTGASARRTGVFEYADAGTVFLDEVGDMPLGTQVKLLRTLESGEVRRLGSNDPLRVDVRLIAATHQELERLVEERRFRQDLYYRLKVITVTLPPLRERKADIPLFIDAFLAEFSAKHQHHIAGLTDAARRALYHYHWPGNVRELRNCIENMVVLARGPLLDVDNIPADILAAVATEGLLALPPGRTPTPPSLTGKTVREVERELITQTLEHTKGDRGEAARMLGISERTLYRKLKRYGLTES